MPYGTNQPIDTSRLDQEDYRIMAMFQIFAKAVGKQAGKAPSMEALKDGLDVVFRWWCKHGVWLGGEPDFADLAAQVAVEVAGLAYENDTIHAAVNQLRPSWLQVSCARSRPGMPGGRSSSTPTTARYVSRRVMRAGLRR